MRTEAAVLLLETETETKGAPDLRHTAGENMNKLLRLSQMKRCFSGRKTTL